jgi:5-methyltetrahydropteroyltriglutamate--homocysteine methyltransferase
MEILDLFKKMRCPNEIKPEVYDIHSPRILEVSEIEGLLERALGVLFLPGSFRSAPTAD